MKIDSKRLLAAAGALAAGTSLCLAATTALALPKRPLHLPSYSAAPATTKK